MRWVWREKSCDGCLWAHFGTCRGLGNWHCSFRYILSTSTCRKPQNICVQSNWRGAKQYILTLQLLHKAFVAIRITAVAGKTLATVTKHRERNFKSTGLGNILLAFTLAITYSNMLSPIVREPSKSGRDIILVIGVVLLFLPFYLRLRHWEKCLAWTRIIAGQKGTVSRVFKKHEDKPTIDLTNVAALRQPFQVKLLLTNRSFLWVGPSSRVSLLATNIAPMRQSSSLWTFPWKPGEAVALLE